MIAWGMRPAIWPGPARRGSIDDVRTSGYLASYDTVFGSLALDWRDNPDG